MRDILASLPLTTVYVMLGIWAIMAILGIVAFTPVARRLVPVIKPIYSVIDSFTETVGRLNGFVVTLMIVAGFYNVVARYVGRELRVRLTSNTLIELQWYMFSVMFFLGFAYILKHNQNVRVDFLYSRWQVHTKAMVNLIGHILVLIPFCIMGVYVTISPVLFSWGRLPNGKWGIWEVSADPGGLPRAPIKTMIIVAFVLLFIQAIAEILKHLAVMSDALDEATIHELEDAQIARME